MLNILSKADLNEHFQFLIFYTNFPQNNFSKLTEVSQSNRLLFYSKLQVNTILLMFLVYKHITTD